MQGAGDQSSSHLAAASEQVNADESKKNAHQANDLLNIKTVEETTKIRLESAKIRSDLAWQRQSRYLEWVKGVGAIASLLVALVAIISLMLTSEASRQTEERAERQIVSTIMDQLGSQYSPVRSAAAIRLAVYLPHETYGASSISSLAFALSLESESQVQDAMLQALIAVGRAAREPLRDARLRLDQEIPPLFSRRSPGMQDVDPDVKDRIAARQSALIKITLALSRLDGCEAATCQPDFSNLISLRGSKFISYQDRLVGGRFVGAYLTEADFYETDLRDANFSEARLPGAKFVNAKLRGARFDGAGIQRILVTHNNSEKRAIFKGADLQDATFVNSCLSGADLRGALNLSVKALAAAYTKGVLLEPELLEELGTVREHKRCSDLQE